jgi:hypothetical protein
VPAHSWWRGRWGAAVAAAACIALALASLGEVAPRRARSAFDRSGGIHRGVVFGLFARDEPAYARRALSEIRALGADSVSIVLPWVTPDVRSLRLEPREDMTPSDRSLRRAIREAHRQGLSVLLLPIVYVDRMGEQEWRGTIDPPDWKGWFASYGRMILHYAALAEEQRVEFLSVGSELCSTEERGAEWMDLIARVRAAYRGALTYSANWDHRTDLPFAGALDFIGMNAYFEVGADPADGVERLIEEWKPVLRDVEAWRSRFGKPLLVTEVGYPARRGACADPWNYQKEGPADPEAQAACYRAFVGAWTGYRGLAGVYFYLWWGDGGPADAGYTPRGKPAERVITRWFEDLQRGVVE